MVVTIIAVLSENEDTVAHPDNKQVILSQVESEDVKEVEEFVNSIARFCDEAGE